MCRAALVALGITLLTSAQAAAGAAPSFQVLSSDESGLRLVFELPEMDSAPVSIADVEFQLLAIPGGQFSGDVGAPAIPTITKLVAVPEGATVSVRCIPLEEHDMTGLRLVPIQPDDGHDLVYDPEAYLAPPPGSPESAVAGRPAMLRGLQVVPITFRPVRYDPATRTAHVTSRMQVDIGFQGGTRRSGLAAGRVPSSFDALYRELLLNYDGPTDDAAVVPGTCLVICPNNPAVVDSLRRLVDWRTRRGMPTLLATTAETGTSRTQIKAYIQALYNNPDVALEYVTLVGDASGTYSIATWYETQSGYNGEGDLPYAQLEGLDALPDIHVGRLSIEDLATLGYVISKIIGYETAPEMSDPDWFTRSCIVGDPYSSGWSTVETGRWLCERLAEIGYAQQDTIFSNPFVSRMTTALNRGDTAFGYRGYYGMSGWGNGLTNTLTNGWKMPFVVTITCDTGSFASGTSRSEGFLRAWNSTNGIPRGGIGAIGMSTIGTHTRYNNCLYYGVWRGFAAEGLQTMGAARTRGCVELYLNYDDAEPWRVEIWSHWANLMGDPAVDVWTAVPRTLAVSHPANLPRGSTFVPVTVTDGSGPVEGALVCLWKGTETYVVRPTDATGRVDLPVLTPTNGSMLLTVTQHNAIPYQATLPVFSPGLFVSYAASGVDDDASGESAGNDDGLVNPGETIELRVQLSNPGTSLATGVRATLTCNDPYVTITDADETFADLVPGSAAWCVDDFGLTLRTDCPHGHIIPIGLDIEAAGFAGHALFELAATSADLVAGATTVYDAGPNFIFDPGETVGLSVKLENSGGAAADAVRGTLISLSSRVVVEDDQGNYGTIGIGAVVENPVDRFSVSADSDLYDGYIANFQLITEFSGGTTDTTSFGLTVGTRQAGDPIGPDQHGYLAFDNTDTAYPEAPVYGWIEIDPAFGGTGTEIVMGDYGEYQDKSTTVDLPFPFVYYGQTYSQGTACSNGWLAFGSTISTSYRNWTIPGAGGPNALVAPFWDDLYQYAPMGSKVVQKYDVANHRWILEWSRMRNSASGSTETFELVLYDPAFYPTEGGDGFILFQYDTVSNTDGTDGYATAGIESPDQSDGLLYTYFNRYPMGAAALAAGRAIRFVPTIETMIGTLQGVVRNASMGGQPLPDASIEILETAVALDAGDDGHYSGQLPPGTYTVVASHPKLAPDTTAGVTITRGRATTLDFDLTDIVNPVITTTPHASTDDTVGPYAIPVTLVEYSGFAEKTLYYRTDTGAFTPLTLLPQGGDDYLAEIPGQPFTTYVSYYVYARDGAGLVSLDPPGAPADLYAFAVTPLTALEDNGFETASGWSVGAPEDDATSGLWTRADPVGTVYHGFPIQPEDDHSAGAGTVCFATGNANPGDPATTNDVDHGQTTLFSPVFDLSGVERAEVDYWFWYSNHRTPTTGDDYWVVEITANGTDWIPLENTPLATMETWAHRVFNVADYVPFGEHVQFRFVAADLGSDGLVEAALDDFRLVVMPRLYTGVEGGAAMIVRESGLDSPSPNPFGGETRIQLRIAQPGVVRIGVYDVAGRCLRMLVNEARASGEYVTRWDGRNATGERVGPGMYYARFETAGTRRVEPMMLLR